MLKKRHSDTHRDYGGELLSSNSDIMSGVEFLCALDEQTCLKCLELDGSKSPPPLPIHQGCRCVALPRLKTWKELGINLSEIGPSTRSSAIGQVPQNGGLYKAYLIARARAIQNGLSGFKLGELLRACLPELLQQFPTEDKRIVAAVDAAVMRHEGPQSAERCLQLLQTVSWTSSDIKSLVESCISAGFNEETRRALAKLAQQVPEGPYAGRHRAMLYRTSAVACKKHAPMEAAKFLKMASELDSENTAIFIELGKALRQLRLYADARHAFERALQLNPTLKSAKVELQKLSK